MYSGRLAAKCAGDGEVRRWGALRVSLREMQQELAHLHLTPLALRTLNRRLQQVASAPMPQDGAQRAARAAGGCDLGDATGPDGQLPSRCQRSSAAPTKSASSGRFSLPWASGRKRDRPEVLAWRLAAKEDEAEWLAFLSDLEAMGIRGENGLELIIHDGGSGLCAALRTLYFGAAEQRCLFHKRERLPRAAVIFPKRFDRHGSSRRKIPVLIANPVDVCYPF